MNSKANSRYEYGRRLAATRANNELRRLTQVLNSRVAQLEVEVARNQIYIATLTSPEVRVVTGPKRSGKRQNFLGSIEEANGCFTFTTYRDYSQIKVINFGLCR